MEEAQSNGCYPVPSAIYTEKDTPYTIRIIVKPGKDQKLQKNTA